ncbi:MAG: hypothetical protein M0P70_06265 [Desulfobulbaceae bacterium]|nr:hypothetical protein [Desulfobulbaceae bacterium]
MLPNKAQQLAFHLNANMQPGRHFWQEEAGEESIVFSGFGFSPEMA